MDYFSVRINGERILIDKSVFLLLLENSAINTSAVYQAALLKKEIGFNDLKSLASKARIPYPFFFAPKDVVEAQKRYDEVQVLSNFAGKDEISISFRGMMKINIKNIDLIIKDLTRKQEFFKKRILPSEPDNDFVGFLIESKRYKLSLEEQAEEVRKYFDINLSEIRKRKKSKILEYFRDKVEKKNIIVSFSSYNYMPQNIKKENEFSGLCVKDRKFPWIFINTKDGEDEPFILETYGRQAFTLVYLLTYISKNKFTSSFKNFVASKDLYELTEEILIPKKDLSTVKITSFDGLQECSEFYGVTPSMLVMRLFRLKIIDDSTKKYYLEELNKKRTESKKKDDFKPRIMPLSAYMKYNGRKFSKEIVKAFRANRISNFEVKGILFANRKTDKNLLTNYCEQFK